MIASFYRGLVGFEPDETFNRVKTISDYVGMITRLVFIQGLIKFATKIEFSENSLVNILGIGTVCKTVTLLFLYGLSLTLSVGVAIVTANFVVSQAISGTPLEFFEDFRASRIKFVLRISILVICSIQVFFLNMGVAAMINTLAEKLG